MLSEIGPLDEGFFMYCEEIDWCRRIRDHGWRILCVPSTVVVHHGGASTAQFRAETFVHLWRSRRRLSRLYDPRWKRLIIDCTIRAGFLSRTLADVVAERRGRIAPGEGARRRAAIREVFAVKQRP